MKIWVIAVLIALATARMFFAVPQLKPNQQTREVWGRKYLQMKLLKWLPGDSGALGAGILLGGDDDLSYKAVLAFRRAGLSHVTAASGYNVVVVSGWIMGMFSGWWGKRRAIYIGILCILGYMYLAGMTIPVVRAGIMVLMGYVALLLGRKADAWWSLALTTMAMIIVNPAWAFEVSFQLSVAATVGVILAGGQITNAILLNFKTSLAAWATTLPIVVHHFGQFSLVAPLANLVVVWMVPWVMEVLGVAMGVGLVWDWAGQILALVAWPGLQSMLVITGWFASLPGASIQMTKLGWLWVYGYYLVIFLAAWKWRRRWQ